MFTVLVLLCAAKDYELYQQSIYNSPFFAN
jgi:hypothetical protein